MSAIFEILREAILIVTLQHRVGSPNLRAPARQPERQCGVHSARHNSRDK
jgi:hypothetical protein